MDPSSIWNVHQCISAPASDGARARVPTLSVKGPDGETTEVESDEAKAEVFHKTFFFPKPEDIPTWEEEEYPEPCEDFKEMTETQMRRVIQKMKPYKAGGNDGFVNAIFTHCREALVPTLTRIGRATFKLKYWPNQWKISTTLVLRKPGKANYRLAKAWRPVKLIVTFSNMYSSVVGDMIVYYCEKHNLLPKHSFGGRPARSCVDALMTNVQWIYEKWIR